MIVKFAQRGKGGGSGPVDYLLGKNRDREGATLDRGNPEQVKDLIDSSPYAKKYTTGYLSFAEPDLPREVKDRLMSEFQEALLPGLDADQYSVLWIEHRDKGRLELNFVVPNVELQTGKRLQPYFHAADKPRIDAWRTMKNIELNLKDPDDPANRQPLVHSSNVPPDIKDVGTFITDGLLKLAKSGEIKNRDDVIATLEGKGFEISRVTAKSISIKNPESADKKNIRLKGLIYEQDFRFGEGLQRAIEEASERYRAAAQRRLQEARTTYTNCFERKREDNQKRHKRPDPTLEQTRTQNMGFIARDGRFGLASLMGGDVVAGNDYRPEPTRNKTSGNRLREAESKDVGSRLVSRQRGALSGDSRGVHNSKQVDNERRQERTHQASGEVEHDGIRNPIIERIRAIADAARNTTKGICEAIQRFSGAIREESAGERAATEQRQQLNEASQRLDRATPAVSEILQREKSLERHIRGMGFSR